MQKNTGQRQSVSTMELGDMQKLVLSGDTQAFKGARLEPVHVQACRKLLGFSPDFAGWVRRAKVPKAVIDRVLVPEGIYNVSTSKAEFTSRRMLGSDDMLAALFMALAHRSWSTIQTVVTALKVTEAQVAALKQAHKHISRSAIQGERLCVFCAPSTATGDMATGKRARMHDNVLDTLKAEGLQHGDNLIALKLSGEAGHTDIAHNTLFADIAFCGRADVRLSAKRKRAVD